MQITQETPCSINSSPMAAHLLPGSKVGQDGANGSNNANGGNNNDGNNSGNGGIASGDNGNNNANGGNENRGNNSGNGGTATDNDGDRDSAAGGEPFPCASLQNNFSVSGRLKQKAPSLQS